MDKKVSNIPTDILKDSDGRYVLDSYSKVLNYILSTSNDDEINLSNCVIEPSSNQISFDIRDLFNLAKSKGINLKIGITNNSNAENEIIVSKRLICYNSILKKAVLSNTKFEQFVSFGNSILKDIHFTHSIFSKGLSISKSSVIGYMACNSIHASNVYLFDVNYAGSLFDFSTSKIASISILSSTFKYSEKDLQEEKEKPGILHTDLNFAFSVLGDVFISKVSSELFITFLNASVKDRVRVFDCDLQKGIIFEETKLSGRQSIIQNTKKFDDIENSIIAFNGCKIESDLAVIGMSCDYIGAEDCYIAKEGRLSIFHTETNNIFLQRASIYGELNINHINAEASRNVKSFCNINMECAINLGNINIRLDNIRVTNYDTAKILRLAAQKLNNSIEVTTLKAIEHRLFLKENKLQCTYTSMADHLLLWLNKVSNNFGTNWLTGCLFCVFVSIISVTIIGSFMGEYSFCLNPKDWIFITQDFWMKTFEFLWLPNLDSYKNLLANSGCNPYAIFSFIVGKSLIAYGVFQTVVAFRKYCNK